MTRLPSPPIEPPHRLAQRASARKSFDSAEQLWVTTQEEEPADRAVSDETLRVLYRHCAKAALSALTPDGVLGRWLEPGVWELEASPAVRALVPHPLVVQLASGDYEAPSSTDGARRQAEGLLAIAEEAQRGIERARTRRVVKFGSMVAVALALATATIRLVAHLNAPVDLASGHPWTASSKFADCFPDKQECGGAKTTIFFHTREEESPWLQIDLQAPTRFSSATIENRLDAGLERAIPLVIEVSADAATWVEVARTEQLFETWKPKFVTQTARFVRVKVPRRTIFHLTAVKIHP